MPYLRIGDLAALPPEGPLSDASREKHDLEFKTPSDFTDNWEQAKDIAAMANSLGGTIIFGATDKPKVHYVGIGERSAKTVMEHFDAAALACVPPVPIDPVPIEVREGVTVIAVNVPPFPESAVASPATVKLKGKKQADGTRDEEGQLVKADHGWRFPIRRSSQTHYMQPLEFSMYMHPPLRRAFVLLDRIPHDKRNDLRIFYMQRPGANTAVFADLLQKMTLTAVSLEKNHFKIQGEVPNNLGLGLRNYCIPLTNVVDVWVDLDDKWCVQVTGRIHRDQTQPSYFPVPG